MKYQTVLFLASYSAFFAAGGVAFTLPLWPGIVFTALLAMLGGWLSKQRDVELINEDRRTRHIPDAPQ